MRRLLTILLGTVLAVPLWLGGPALAETVRPIPGKHHFTTQSLRVAVHDGPGRTHTTTLEVRLYRPGNATVRHPKPAVLVTHGFGGSYDSAEVVHTAEFLARHGYVVMTWSSQGFGGSTGCISLDSRAYDMADQQQLITKVLGPRKWIKHDRHGPVLGAVGGSYGGGYQANLAENDKRIHAIVPFRTWNNLQYSLDPNNYVAPDDPTGFSHQLNTQGVFKREWTTAFFASGSSRAAGDPSQRCTGDVNPASQQGIPCAGFRLELCQTFARISVTGDGSAGDRAILADSSATKQLSRWRTPTLLVQGQSDTLFNLNEAISSYLSLRRQHTPVKMIWNSGGHGGYDSQPGECEMFDGNGGGPQAHFDRCYLPLRVLMFFNHWLKGRPDPSPAFSYYQDWVKPYAGTGPSDTYGSAASFPLPGTRTFTLSAGGNLATGAARPGSDVIVAPGAGGPFAYSETSNFSGPDSSPSVTILPIDQPGQFVNFSSPVLRSAVTTVGAPTLRVRLTHTAPGDIRLFAKLYDVEPNGAATLIHRLIAPARIPAAMAGRVVTIKLLAVAHRFLPGHRIRVQLCTTDATSYNNATPDTITVASGPGNTFTIPAR